MIDLVKEGGKRTCDLHPGSKGNLRAGAEFRSKPLQHGDGFRKILLKGPGSNGVELRIGQRSNDCNLFVGFFLQRQQALLIAQQDSRALCRHAFLAAVFGGAQYTGDAGLIDVGMLEQAHAHFGGQDAPVGRLYLLQADFAWP